VQLRSLKRPGLNFAIRAVEALQRENESDASLEILNTLVVTAAEPLGQSEPAFQLYVGVLLRRTEDVLTKFHVLSQLFRDHPGYISQSTLSMLYPTSRLEVVERVDDHVGAKIDPFLVLSLMRQESAFNERALSTAGAVGLMQVMPATGRKYGHVARRKLFDPQVNIRVGVQFFSKLLDRYDGDAEYSLAAYNAGPDRVDDWKKRYPIDDRLLFLDLIPFRETREYVASITRNYYFYLKLYDSSRQPEQSSFFPVFKKHAAR
jgi:soluble lytic murein transglycosylase